MMNFAIFFKYCFNNSLVLKPYKNIKFILRTNRGFIQPSSNLTSMSLNRLKYPKSGINLYNPNRNFSILSENISVSDPSKDNFSLGFKNLDVGYMILQDNYILILSCALIVLGALIFSATQIYYRKTYEEKEKEVLDNLEASGVPKNSSDPIVNFLVRAHILHSLRNYTNLRGGRHYISFYPPIGRLNEYGRFIVGSRAFLAKENGMLPNKDIRQISLNPNQSFVVTQPNGGHPIAPTLELIIAMHRYRDQYPVN
jgi:hypothetical protein